MEVFVLNQQFQTIYILDTYKSLIWTDRYSICGDFEICCQLDVNLLNYIQLDNYLKINQSNYIMIIEKIEIISDVDEGNLLIISGRSLESILDRRVLFGEWSWSGNLQNGIQNLLNSQLTGARSLVIFYGNSDPGITSLQFDGKYTGDNLYNIITDLCEEFNIGYSVWLSQQNQFCFRLYKGQDRSYIQTQRPYVVFSPKFDNIISSNFFTSNEKYKNVAFVYGEQSGNIQTEVVGFAGGLQRREMFVDARDIDLDPEQDSSQEEIENMHTELHNLLKARGNSELSKNKIAKAFEGKIETRRLYIYGRDFFIGDTVQVEDNYGNTGSSVVIEAVISVDSGQISIYPTFKTIEEG